MGSLTARELIDQVKKGQALAYHLRCNHFPPIHLAFVETAKKAIKFVNQGKWDKVIKMPNGIKKTAGGIIEGLHLEFFLDEYGKE